MLKKLWLGVILTLGIATGVAPTWAADAFPSQTIQLIVPSTPGGGLDQLGRILGPLLSEKWGQPVVVENKPGAGGVVGTGLVAAAKPDGHTLLIVANGFTANPYLYENIPYNAKTAFEPITMIASSPLVLLSYPPSGLTALSQVIEQATVPSPTISYGSSGVGSSGHLTMELLQQRMGSKLIHAAFKGGGGSGTALISGEVQLLFTSASAAIPHVKGGQATAVAVTSLKRYPLLPDVPAISETYPDFQNTSWFGLFAPTGTPKEAIDEIYSSVAAILEKPDVKKQIEDLGFDVEPNTPEQFKAFIDKELVVWGDVIKSAGIKGE